MRIDMTNISDRNCFVVHVDDFGLFPISAVRFFFVPLLAITTRSVYVYVCTWRAQC